MTLEGHSHRSSNHETHATSQEKFPVKQIAAGDLNTTFAFIGSKGTPESITAISTLPTGEIFVTLSSGDTRHADSFNDVFEVVDLPPTNTTSG